MAKGSVRGMIQVAGATYRIVRVSPGEYSAIRILDEEEVGRFTTRPSLHVTMSRIDLDTVVAIACSALRGGKLIWEGPVAGRLGTEGSYA